MPALKLFWDSVPGASSYTVFWKTTPGVSVLNGSPITGITSVVFHHTDLLENTTYYYIIVAVDGDGNLGPPSIEFSGQSSTVVSLSISPTNADIGINAQQQYSALVLYSDGYTGNVTLDSTWDTDNHAIATIDSGGLLTGVLIGTTNVTVQYQTYSANVPIIISHTLVSLTIAPLNATILSGAQQQYIATGHYNDLTTSDITTLVTWGSTNLSAATISNTGGSEGLATGAGGGNTTISATLGLLSDSTSLTVTPVLQSIVVTPTTPTVVYPNQQQFTATGHYSDLSTSDLTSVVAWTSGTPANATINISSGLALTVHSGTSLITATLGLISGNTLLTVSHTVTSVGITPTAPTLYIAGNTQQFTAIANYNDGDTLNVTASATWQSSVIGVATINSSGLATAVATGATNITATFSSVVSNTAVLTFPSWTNQTGPGVSGDNMINIYGYDDSHIIAGGQNSGNPVIWKWNGSTWTTALRGPGSAFSSNNGVQYVKVSPAGTRYFASNIRSIVYSDDGGTSWTEMTQGVPGQFTNGFVPITDTTIWCHCGNNGTNFFKRSTDSGGSWSTIFTFPDGNTVINNMFAFSGSDIFAVGNHSGVGVVWHYDGSSWTQTSPWTVNSGAGGSPMSDIFSVWGTSSSNMYIAGTTSFVSTPTKSAIVHSTDMFGTYTAQTFATGSISSAHNIFGTTSYTPATIYASADDGTSNFLVYAYQPGISTANQWSNAGAVNGTPGASQSVWVNDGTGRAVAIGEARVETNNTPY